MERLKFDIQYLGLRDDADTFAALASLAFWPARELASGNFTVDVPGIIDVSPFE